jgi:hypothetical protein
MTTTAFITCPECEGEIEAEGEVTGASRYTIGDYGPPGCVFEDPAECDLLSPPCCPYCSADLYQTSIDALIERAENDRCRR